MHRAIADIKVELAERLAELEGQGKLLEAQRLRMRTTFDIEMMEQIGFCSASRTTPATWTAVWRARPRTACSTTSRTTSSS